MNEDQWAKGRELLMRIKAIEQARLRWDRHEVLKALAQVMAMEDDTDLCIRPVKVLDVPLVAQFRSAVLEQLAAEERRLRQEFEKL